MTLLAAGGGSWQARQTLTGTGGFGRSVAIQGERLAVGSDDGRVHVYVLRSGSWQIETIIQKPDDATATFGTSVALSDDDGQFYLTAGEPGGNAVHIYLLINGQWRPFSVIQPDDGVTDTNVGRHVALIENLVFAASPASGLRSGALYFARLGLTPGPVVASDGSFDNRIQIRWADRTDDELGFRIYRSPAEAGVYVPIDRVDADVTTFNDFDASPGSAYDYCVTSFSNDADGIEQESSRACDIGWRPADGRIGGRVATRDGVGVDGIDVCLAPGPNRALLLDGVGGFAKTPALDVLPTSFTVEAWVKRARTDVQEFIVGHGEASVVREGLHFGFRQDGGFVAGFWGDDLEVASSSFGGSYQATQWNHWAVTVDGAMRQVYLNGTPISQGNALGGTYAGQGTFFVGAGPEAVHAFSGLIDEVRVWEGVQSAESIQERMIQRLDASESDLMAYWPLDQIDGVAAPDVTERAAHLSLSGGAYWASGNTAFNACATTDAEGGFVHTGLRYGEGAAFEVSAQADGRTFQPGSQSISLSPESPVQNQTDFTDVSAFSLQGTVRLGSETGACPADSVVLFVDGQPEMTTGADGAFALAVLPTSDSDPDNRQRTITARRTNGTGADLFTFTPEQHVLQVSRDRDGIDFAVETERTLSGFAGGSCGTDIGKITLRVYTESGCFNREFSDEQLAGGIVLPPQRYLVEVVGVSDLPAGSALSSADVLAFYKGLGTQIIDLTAADTTLDFVYRAPVEVSVRGLERGQCESGLAAGSRTLPNVPVIAENAKLNLTVSVVERYSETSVCPVEGAAVSIIDGFNGTTKADTTGADGTIKVASQGLIPELTAGAFVAGFDRSYQRSFEASASVPGRGTTTAIEWAVVEGFREREGEFVTAKTNEIPLLVLHDPPGTESYAYLEKGTTVCSSVERLFVGGIQGGYESELAAGFKGSLGLGIATEADAIAFWHTRVLASTIGGGGSALETCMTTNERYATSTDNSSVSEDIFAGYGINLLFAPADRIAVNGCEATFSETVAFDVDRADPLHTTYTFSATHIKTDLIPRLDYLLKSGPDADPETRDESRRLILQNSLDNWGKVLSDNETNVLRAMSEGEKENRSFSAGTEYEYSHTTDTTRTDTRVLEIGITFENEFGFELEGAGSGTRQGWLLNAVQQNDITRQDTDATTRTVGYVLSDNDTGDFFSVDVGTDPVYGVPAFQMVSGRSSNPWEAGTQKRDVPRISTTPSVLTGIGAGDAASFQLILSNESESGERRPYVLAVPGELNPGNLGLTVTGDLLGGDRTETFRIPAGESQTINLDVLRPPSDVYSFENVGLIYYSDVERSIYDANPERIAAMIDTAYISVHFTPPCSPVELVTPSGGWRVNADTNPRNLLLQARGLELDPAQEQEVGFEYRREGQPWTLINRWKSKDNPGTSVEFNWDPSSANPDADGDYEVRAYTQCKLDNGDPARNNTPVAKGRYDLTPPRIAGSPQPADGALDLGDDVTVRFNEALDCASVEVGTDGQGANAYRSLGIKRLSDGYYPLIDAVCDEDRVVLTPQDPAFWAENEGETFTRSYRLRSAVR